MNGILLSALILLPALGAAAMMLLPRQREEDAKPVALAVTTLVFLGSLLLPFQPPAADGGFFLLEDHGLWLDFSFVRARLLVGVDGVSLWLVMLTTFLTPLTVLSAWRSIDRRAREFCAAMLVLESGMLGAFLALDLLLFYFFWEVMLAPMFFIIGIWGGERRVYATVKFVLYTLAGSLPMFVAILYLFTKTGTLDYLELLRPGSAASGALLALGVPGADAVEGGDFWWSPVLVGLTPGLLLFAAFAFSFAIKVPLFPLHTWLPDAHVEAPTPGSVILAGVLLKFGTYGFVRFAVPLFPAAAARAAPVMAALAVVGILFGALMCMAQSDMKKLVAYSSVSHLGFVTLGIFAAVMIADDCGRRSVALQEEAGYYAALKADPARAEAALKADVDRRVAAEADRWRKSLQPLTWRSRLDHARAAAEERERQARGAVAALAVRRDAAGRAGLLGAILQMVSHGLATGALFLLVGVLYERRHTRLMDDYGGLARVMPVFSVFLMIATLSSVGLPGTAGFVGEFMVLLAGFTGSKWLGAAAVVGVILGAVYMLAMVQKVIFGEIKKEENRRLPDLSAREWLTLAPIAAGILVLGFFPGLLLSGMEPAAGRVLSRAADPRAGAASPPAALAAPAERVPLVAGR